MAFQLQASYLSKWTNEFEAHHHQSQGRETDIVDLMCCIWLVDASYKGQKKIEHGDKTAGQL